MITTPICVMQVWMNASAALMPNAQRQHSTKGLYDSYIRAIRWASDRIGDSGIIGFVTNAGWLDANSADGLRQCLAEEFSSIYIFHLRGNATHFWRIAAQRKR